MQSRKKRVQTPDNWFTTAPDGKVDVSLHKDKKASWRVALLGYDDFGLELGGMQQQEAFALFRKISDGVTISSLRLLGFKDSI